MINISIITVTYNAGTTLKRTLDSIVAQNARNFEHVIVDGQSADNTLEIIHQYMSENPDISVKLVSEPDKGLYDAMNKGLRMAEGQFVCFMNAGDKLHEENVLSEIGALIANAGNGSGIPGVIYGETDIVDASGRFIAHRRLKTPDRLSWKSFKMGMMVCHQSFYANREITPEYNLDYRFSADFDWCVRVMKDADRKGLPLVNTHMILTDYLDEGMTTKNHKQSLKERFDIMSVHYGLIPTVCRHVWFFIRNIFSKHTN